jgi:signal transduction histidine kinase
MRIALPGTAFFSSSLNRLVLLYGMMLLTLFIVIGGMSLVAYDRVVDRDVRQTVLDEHDGLLRVFRAQGGDGLARAIDMLVVEDSQREAVYLLTDASGAVRAGHLSDVPSEVLHRQGWVRFAWNAQGDEVVAYVDALSDGALLVSGHSTGEQQRLRELMMRLGIIMFSLLTGLTLLLGWMLRRALAHSLQTSLDAVDRFVAGRLDERIRVAKGDDPLIRLARTLNRMLDRTSELIGGIQSSTDAIAHDLRTPLTRLKTHLEQTRQRVAGEDAKGAIDDAVAEVDRLMTTFNSLLRLARIEGPGDTPTTNVPLDRIVADAVDMWQAVVEAQGGSIDAEIAPAQINGDSDLLFQMISNLIDNAVKYGPADGRIQVSLRTMADEVRLIIRDYGPGIPEQHRERVFDRFVRMERHRGTPGTGLGLSVVRAIALRHHAELRLEAADPGLRVELLFSLARDMDENSCTGNVSESGAGAV